jgi:hypothetical protein
VVELTLLEVPEGSYDVFVHTFEDNFALRADLFVEGLLVTNYLSGPMGRWDRLGPFRTDIKDGTLQVRYDPINEVAPVCGLELWRVEPPEPDPGPPPRITRIALLPGGLVGVRVAGQVGQNCRVLASTNLIEWMAVSTNLVESSGVFDFLDSSSTSYSSRFYRVMTP